MSKEWVYISIQLPFLRPHRGGLLHNGVCLAMLSLGSIVCMAKGSQRFKCGLTVPSVHTARCTLTLAGLISLHCRPQGIKLKTMVLPLEWEERDWDLWNPTHPVLNACVTLKSCSRACSPLFPLLTEDACMNCKGHDCPWVQTIWMKDLGLHDLCALCRFGLV